MLTSVPRLCEPVSDLQPCKLLGYDKKKRSVDNVKGYYILRDQFSHSGYSTFYLLHPTSVLQHLLPKVTNIYNLEAASRRVAVWITCWFSVDGVLKILYYYIPGSGLFIQQQRVIPSIAILTRRSCSYNMIFMKHSEGGVENRLNGKLRCETHGSGQAVI